MVKSKKACSSPVEATTPSSQEVAHRVATCNYQADFDLEKYDPTLHIMIEFIKGHPLHKPFTKSTEFPLSIIHTAYSTAIYNSKEECIEFKVNEDVNTKLSKDVFLKAIGLPESKEEKMFYWPTNEELFDMVDQMGYLPPRLELTTGFKKAKLPAVWQFLVHIILRCLTGKVGGTDQVNRPFFVFLFGIYSGKDVDFGTIIWKDFASYVYPKKKAIPCARFWALALRMMYTKLKVVPLPEGENMFTPHTISRHTISDQSDFSKVGRLPEAMLQYIDKNSEVLIKYKEETISQESEHPTSSPKRKKQIALNAKKTTGLGIKRKCDIIPSPQPKKRPAESIPASQKVNNVEKHTPSPSSQKEDVCVEKSHEQPLGTHSQINLDHIETEVRTPESESVRQTRDEHELQTQEQSEREESERIAELDLNIDLNEQVLVEKKRLRDEKENEESREAEVKKELKRMLREEQQKKEDKKSAGTIEEDFMFTTDEVFILDYESESPSIMMDSVKVKPSKSKIFLGTSESESEHIEEVPKGKSKTLPTTTTPRRRPKWKKKKKKTKYISRVEFNSLNKKLSEVLEVVRKIPASEEKFVNKEDFGEMQKIVKSLVQSVPNLETREKTLKESVFNSLRDMEHKRTDDTIKYLDRMDAMVQMVKEIQKSYDDLTTTMAHQHRNEIIRINEQLCDYRNKNIILHAVLVKLMQSAHQRQNHNVKSDEVLFAIQKVQNSVNALPESLSNADVSKQVQQLFLKMFELIDDLKGPRVVTKTSEETPKITTPETLRSPIKDKGKLPFEVSEVSQTKTFPVSEEENKQHALTYWVYVTRQLRNDELVPKQTTSPPSSDEYQWDIPMSPNACYYSVFQPLNPNISKEIQIPIEFEIDKLEEFFKAHGQPSKDVWSLRRIIKVLGYRKRSFQNKVYFGFDVVRSDNKEYYFSEADFPNLNPNDLYVIGKHFQNKLLTHDYEPSRFPLFQIQRFLRSLIYDLGSIDAEQSGSSMDNPTKVINNDLEGIENRHRGPTDDPELGIIFSKEKESERLFLRLREKHLCKTEFLKEMIDLTLRSKKTPEALKAKIVEELEWWVAVRKWITRVTNLVKNNT